MRIPGNQVGIDSYRDAGYQTNRLIEKKDKTGILMT